MATLTEAQVIKLLKEKEENSALPFLVFTSAGDIVCANDRAKKLLKIQDLKFPLKNEKLLSHWIFFNEEMSGPAILAKLLSKSTEKILAQFGLKTCRIWGLSDLIPKHVVVLCQLMRRGDLMEDRGSRQHLFRVLAHEIRTSAQILGSYVHMTHSHDPELAKRMEEGVKRLDRAVMLLHELKAELELE